MLGDVFGWDAITWTAIGTIGVTVASLLYAGVTFWLARSARRSAEAAERAAQSAERAALESRVLRSIQRLQHISALLGELEGELRPHGRGPSSPRSRYDAIRRQLQTALVGLEIALSHSHGIAHATQDADTSPQRFAEAFEELRRAIQQEQDQMP